jgi:hypothetical protein
LIQLMGMKYLEKQCKRTCAIFVVQQKLLIDHVLHNFLFLTSFQFEGIDLLSILSTCGIYKHFDPLSFNFFILLIVTIYESLDTLSFEPFDLLITMIYISFLMN